MNTVAIFYCLLTLYSIVCFVNGILKTGLTVVFVILPLTASRSLEKLYSLPLKPSCRHILCNKNFVKTTRLITSLLKGSLFCHNGFQYNSYLSVKLILFFSTAIMLLKALFFRRYFADTHLVVG